MKERKRTAAATMAVMMAGGAFATLGGPMTAQVGKKEKIAATTQSKFFCNTKALTPAERARHKQLSEKMEVARKAVVETEKGYEFQFSPAGVSLAELAEWVGQESKCCPFFDFHIDLEEQGSLLCLRLTGQEGVKEFIRAEFKEAWSSAR